MLCAASQELPNAARRVGIRGKIFDARHRTRGGVGGVGLGSPCQGERGLDKKPPDTPTHVSAAIAEPAPLGRCRASVAEIFEHAPAHQVTFSLGHCDPLARLAARPWPSVTLASHV